MHSKWAGGAPIPIRKVNTYYSNKLSFLNARRREVIEELLGATYVTNGNWMCDGKVIHILQITNWKAYNTDLEVV